MNTVPTTARPIPRWLAIVVASALAMTGAIAGVALPATAAVPFTVTGTLTGLGTPGGTAVPLANVYIYSVSLDSYGNPTYLNGASTDSAGKYSIEFAAAGTYSLRYNCTDATHPACNFAYPQEYLGKSADGAHAKKFSLSATTPTSVQNYTLDKASTITGRIVDASGQPASGAYVNANRPGEFGGAYATADANGVYTMTRVPSGSLVVQAGYWESESTEQAQKFWADTYYGNTTSIDSATAVATTPASSKSNINIAVKLLPSAKIHVVDEAGAPISGVYFSTYKYSDATGEYESPNSGESLGTNATGWYGHSLQPGAKYKFFVSDQRNPSVDDYETPQTRTTNYDSEWFDNSQTVTGATAITVSATSTTQNVLEVVLKKHTGAPTMLGELKIGIDPNYPGELTAVGFYSFSPATATQKRQWYRNGVAISGATGYTYTPTTADKGKSITLKITATIAGSAGGSVTKTSTAYAVPGSITAKTPTITGSAAVGKKLTAVTGTWAPSGVAFTYQWMRNGKVISGATASTRTLTSSDVATAITVVVKGTKSGYTSVTKTSAKTALVAKGAIVAPAPTITGTPKVGATLTATTAGWGPGTVTKTYQWYNNGVKIAAATKSTYLVPSSAKGDAILVKVTGKKTAYTTKTVASVKVTIPAA